MSFPSVQRVMRERGLNVETATEAELQSAIHAALEVDLPLGMEYLKRAAAEANERGETILRAEDPNSALGKQLIRLMGADVPRSILARRLEVGLGFGNCCGVKVVPTRTRDGQKPKTTEADHKALAEEARVTLREQIKLQGGPLASADC